MKELVLLPSGFYGIDGVPAYELVAKAREKMGLSRAKFAALVGIHRSMQYDFEVGKNKSMRMAVRQMRAAGYRVTIRVQQPMN